MAEIVIVPRPVYYAPTARRCYLTMKAAANNEAGAQIRRKYPTEAGDIKSGESGWHWTQDKRLRRVHKRLSRMIIRRFRNRSADNG